MKYLKHYCKIILKIISSRYPYGKTYLLISYLRIILKSIRYHKLRSEKKQALVYNEQVLGLRVYFSTYSQLINLFEEIFIYQVYKLETKKKSPVIVDCGSNIGLSILYFKMLYPASQIIAFEPDPENFNLLEKNIQTNKISNTTLFNFALHSAEGETALYEKVSSLNMSLIASPEGTFKAMVSCKKLSDYISDLVDLVKIDVEGAEVGIIKELIEHKKIQLITMLIIEFHPTITNISAQDFVALITGCNFSCREVDDNLHVGATEKMIYGTNRIR